MESFLCEPCERIVFNINNAQIPFVANFDPSDTRLSLYYGPHHSSRTSLHIAALAGYPVCIKIHHALQIETDGVETSDSYTVKSYIPNSLLNRSKIEFQRSQGVRNLRTQLFITTPSILSSQTPHLNHPSEPTILSPRFPLQATNPRSKITLHNSNISTITSPHVFKQQPTNYIYNFITSSSRRPIRNRRTIYPRPSPPPRILTLFPRGIGRRETSIWWFTAS